MEARFVRVEAMIGYEADRFSMALAAEDKAITKAENAAEKRFESVNAFRNQLSDQSKTFMTRDVFDTFATLSQRDRDDLRNITTAIQLAQTSLMSREQVMDALKLAEAAVERNRDDIGNLRAIQTRVAGAAIGVSAAISAIGILAAVVFRLASGN